MPVIKFGSASINIIHGYPLYPYSLIKLFSLFKLESVVKGNIEIIRNFPMVLSSAKSALPVYIILRIALWAIPILLAASVILYIFKCKRLSQYIGIAGLVCNFGCVLFFLFGLSYFVRHYYSIHNSTNVDLYSNLITGYIYLLLIMIGFVALFRVKREN
jgi:hypothetical protein